MTFILLSYHQKLNIYLITPNTYKNRLIEKSHGPWELNWDWSYVQESEHLQSPKMKQQGAHFLSYS